MSRSRNPPPRGQGAARAKQVTRVNGNDREYVDNADDSATLFFLLVKDGAAP